MDTFEHTNQQSTMSLHHLYRLTLISISLFVAVLTNAQNPVNWTPSQLMMPAQLADMITENKPLPVIISVGPGSVIKNSIEIGSVKEAANMTKLQTQLANLPKDTSIVVYCGCCSYEHCPNVRPTIDLLKNMQFTNYKLLDLPKNIKTDWVDKRYPTKN
jgi:thiosulfate/3-mercaptopyruvate sulfurtransferase